MSGPFTEGYRNMKTAQSVGEPPGVELITQNNGVIMPSVGLGVYQTPPNETVAALEASAGSSRSGSRRSCAKQTSCRR
jgi:hypothetical protein